MNKKQNWTDQDLDALLESVEQTLNQAEALAKSQSLKKDDDQDKDDAPEAPAAPAAPDQAPDEVPPAPADDQPAQPPVDQPADDQAQPPQEGDQALEQEGQGEDAPLSDEELHQIYSSMPPEELERHFSILREALSSAYGDQGQEQQQDQPDQAQPQQPPQVPQVPAQQPAAPDMEKSEKMMALEKRVAEQAQALEQITKAFEVLAKPTRKSITDIQVMAKSEEVKAAPMTKDAIKSAYMKIPASSLTKSERDLANNFFLHGEGKTDMEKLINSKGGK